MKQSTTVEIPGYDFGDPAAAHSPISLGDLRQIEAAAGWTENDAAVLRKHSRIFEEKAEEMVGAWRSVIGSQPALAHWFVGPDGKPDERYKASVKQRFVQWVRDACSRPHDQSWLDYQEEIGLRHTPDKKNVTDHAHTPSVVPLRYLYGFVPVVALSARKFFVDAGVSGEELRKLEDAWLKTVILHVVLWSRPYCKDGLW
ncbi:MAG TPA: protoglobin domain-containing protein [Bryobacteraceae bacterium]|nr:protoglobin domain-containing protein [Bryobacteraceae bacterium]